MLFLKRSLLLALTTTFCLFPMLVQAENLRVELVGRGFQHDFWKSVRLGAEKAGREFGASINFVGPDNENAIAQQLEMIKNAINKKPAALCISAMDINASLEVLETAKNRKIPIIGFDSGVNGAPAGTCVASAATDNYAAGVLAATKLLEALKPKLLDSLGKPVRIGIVSQDSNADSVVKRTFGFTEKLVADLEAIPEIGKGQVAVIGHDKFANGLKTGKVIIEVRVPVDVTDSAGTTEAQTILNKPDLIAVFGSNEFAAKCLINANETLNRLGKGKVLAVGFDSGALQIDAVKNGIFIGAVTQDPVSIGYTAVKLAVAAAKGQPVADVDTGCQWYNADNLANPDIASNLYQ